MALQILTTMPGAGALDYALYLSGYPVKTDRVGDVDLFDFSIIPFGSNFKKLVRGAYIRVRTNSFDPWFTGYITNEPTLTFMGSSLVNGIETPHYGYVLQASSDEYLLNIKPVGIFPPFLNTTQGAILKAIIDRIDSTGAFDTSGINDGQLVARFVVDPTKSINDIIKTFCDAANYMFYCQDHACHFVQRDITPATIVIDGSDRHFTHSNLKVTQTSDPVINDCTVLGGVEPQDYITELFLGDGYTAQYPLMSSVFGVDSAKLLDDDFSSSTIDNTKWNVYDTQQNFLQVSGGYINCLGGSGSNTLDVSLQSANVIPLDGHLRITHGQYDFVSASDGVVCSLWTGAVGPTLSGCFYGLLATKNGSATDLTPIVNGVPDYSQSLELNYAYRYVIRTVLQFSDVFRVKPSYSYMVNGAVTTVNGTPLPTLCDAQTWITAIDPSNATVQGTTIFQNTQIRLNTHQLFATYVPIAANDLHVSMSGVTISTPMQVAMGLRPRTDQTYTQALVGPNEMDSLDGLQPLATVTDANNGASTKSSFLGTPQYNPGQAILQFFKDTSQYTTTVPSVGTFIKLNYRHAGSAIARVADRTAIATESAAWLDDGIRSSILTSLSPQPRTSHECELAAAAQVGESAYPRFQGTYTQTYPYSFTGEPRAGSILSFRNLPPEFPATLVSETISTVKTTMIAMNTLEAFQCDISFGPTDLMRQVLTNFTTSTDVFAPVDSAEIPNAISSNSVGLVYAPQVLGVDLTGLDAGFFYYSINAAFATSGGFEVRYTNNGWGPDPGKNLVGRYTTLNFAVPRTLRGRSLFVRQYDARNLWTNSDNLTLHASSYFQSTMSVVYGKGPQGGYQKMTRVAPTTQIPSIEFYTGVQPIPYQNGVCSISVKGPVGTTVNWSAVSHPLSHTDATIVCNGGWQRISCSFLGLVPPAYLVMSLAATAPIFVCEASVELGTATETVYCRTNGFPYGALSQYAAGIRVSYPLIPPPPTGQFSYLYDPTVLTLTITLPVHLNDVWGVEIRTDPGTAGYGVSPYGNGYGDASGATAGFGASNYGHSWGDPPGAALGTGSNIGTTNVGPGNILFHNDLTDPAYTGTYTIQTTTRTTTLYLYTYNLLGEYSSGNPVTITIGLPQINSLTIDDTKELLQWTSTPPLSLHFLIEADGTDATFQHTTLTATVSGNQFTIPDKDFFDHRWFRVTPIDSIGPGTPVVIEHVFQTTDMTVDSTLEAGGNSSTIRIYQLAGGPGVSGSATLKNGAVIPLPAMTFTGKPLDTIYYINYDYNTSAYIFYTDKNTYLSDELLNNKIRIGVVDTASDFTVIPIQGGGSIGLGAGTGPSGTLIPLPTGHVSSNLLSFASIRQAYSYNTQAVGVSNCNASNGVLTAEMEGRNNTSWTGDANWIAASWSSDAVLSSFVNSGVRYVQFTTINGDVLCFASGTLANGATLAAPTGFSYANMLYCTAMASVNNNGNGLHGVWECGIDGSGTVLGQYSDSDGGGGNHWTGNVNVFAVFWQPSARLIVETGTNRTALTIPLAAGHSMCILQQLVTSNSPFQLPSAFALAGYVVCPSMVGFLNSGDNVAHGWTHCEANGVTLDAEYRDGSGNSWPGIANMFVIATL